MSKNPSLVTKDMTLMHKTHTSNHKENWVAGEQSWNVHYVAYDSTIQVPEKGVKSYLNKVYCPGCGDYIKIKAFSEQSRKFYVRLAIFIYVSVLVTLFIVGAGMLSVFGIIPGGIFFLHFISGLEKQFIVYGHKPDHQIQVDNIAYFSENS